MPWAKFLVIAVCLAATAFTQDDAFFDDPRIPMADDPSSEGSSDSSSNPLGVIGVVTLWPKDSQQPQRRRQERPRPDRCPKWSDWKNVTCWWPSMSFTDLPQECTYMPLPKKIPKDVQDLIRGKAQEAYDAIVYEYEQRGKPPKCGYCSRSFRCRSRNVTQAGDDDSMNDFDRRHHRRGGRGRDQCKPKEIQPVHDECEDHSPCEVTKENGICKTPFFLNPAKIDRVRSLMKQKDHQGAADELFASMTENSDKRRKRQAGFNDDYGSDVYEGYGMNPQYNSPNGFEDNGRRGPFRFNGRPGRPGPPQQRFGPGPENEDGPFGPGPFGPGGDDRRGGPEDRRGRQGPPPSFGPGDEGQRGPFGPREDERRGPFEPNGRRGRQGPPPPPPFGPQGEDNRRGPFGPRDDDRWGPSEGRRHGPPPPPPPFGPAGDDEDRPGRQGPPPPPPFGPDGEGRRGPPFGPGRRDGPPPPFGPAGDDQEWGPFGPRGWGPFGPPGWGPFGPGRKGGRHGPPPPPFGPGGDERRGRQWPPRPWGPSGRGHHGFPPRHGPWGFGDNQENEDFNQRQTSMFQTISPNRGGDDSRGFVYRLLHETNCVNANDTCLCCCGPYIPNIVNKTCDDLRQLFPGIEDTADALLGSENSDSESPLEVTPIEELFPSPELPFEEMQPPQRRQNPETPSGPQKIPKPVHDFK